MSLISTGVLLTQRATIERYQNAGQSSGGWLETPDWVTHLSDLQCRLWETTGREAVISQASVVVVADMRLIVKLGTDVTEADRLALVTERGATVLTGPVSIRAVLRHDDHLELILVRTA